MLRTLWSPHAVQTMFPDAVNQPHYPSSILRPGGEFRQQVIWRFFNTPASTGSSSQGSCQSKFPGCKQCSKAGKCTACTRSSDIPDPKTSKVGRGWWWAGVGRPTAGVLLGGGAQCRVSTAAHPRSPARIGAACLQCRPKTCAEANPGCTTCKAGDLNVCIKCQRTHSLVSKTKKASWSGGFQLPQPALPQACRNTGAPTGW